MKSYVCPMAELYWVEGSIATTLWSKDTDEPERPGIELPDDEF